MGKNKNRNNFFLDSDDLGKLLDTLKTSFSDSVREFIGKDEEKVKPPTVPVRNSELVEQKPKEIKSSRESVKSFEIFSFISFAIGAIVIASGLSDVFSQGMSELPTFVVGFVFLAGGFVLRKNLSEKKKISNTMQRYLKYLRAFGDASICNVKELASFLNVSENTVLEDFSYYIQNDYLKQARIIDGAVMLDNKTYEQYKMIPHTESEKENSEDTQYVKSLLKYYELIDEPVKSDVKELLLIVEKIYSNAQENEDEIKQLDRFKAYYLPAILKLLDQYEKLQHSGVDSPKLQELRRDIEGSVKIINEAFRNLLEDMYEGSAIDIKTDISVLKNMLYQEGLLDRF